MLRDLQRSAQTFVHQPLQHNQHSHVVYSGIRALYSSFAMIQFILSRWVINIKPDQSYCFDEVMGEMLLFHLCVFKNIDKWLPVSL